MNRNIALWFMAGLLLLFMFSSLQGPRETAHSQIPFSDFLAEVETGQVEEVTLRGSEVIGTYEDGRAFRTYAPEGADIVAPLTENKVGIKVDPPSEPSLIWSLLISAFPILLLIAVWIYFMRRMQGGAGGGGIMGVGKSRARMLTQDSRRVTFEDVAGIDEAKQELE
ncbi:MAG: ATP-dependent metallopeptidase FtsH/Yme1/Tma family protein, partial [Candidatus Binatia bacterium]